MNALYLDGQQLRTALATLQQQAEQQGWNAEKLRRETARLTVQHLIIQRQWYGPMPCEDCIFFHGRNGLSCAPHPTGPPGEHCPDWSGPERAGDNYYYLPHRGWTLQHYRPGQGWIILRDHIHPEEVSAALELTEYFSQ
jgi:hypothetical protein